MGSCLSKSSSKNAKKKSEATSLTEQRNLHLQTQQPWKTPEAGEEDEEEEASSLVMDDPPCSPALSLENESAASLPLKVSFVRSDKPMRPPASPPVQNPSPSPPLLPEQAQVPMKKKPNGELPTKRLTKPSSPCKSLLHNMPSSPGLKKSVHKNEEDECRFPSLARKHWLSQACVLSKGPGPEDNSTEGSKADVNREKDLSNTECITLPRSMASKEIGTEPTQRMKRGHAAKAISNTGRSSYAEAKTVSSRTNSLSRGLSSVETSRAKARPSSPSKRSPSFSAAEGPHLTRSASSKIASPNPVGLHASDRHGCAKSLPHHKPSLSKEFLRDPSADISTHKSSSSREIFSEFSAAAIRRPSPPKKTPIIPLSEPLMSSVDTIKLRVVRPSTPVKESVMSHKSQEPSSMAQGGRSLVQRNLSSAVVHEADNLTRNTKRKENSPLRRKCNGIGALQTSTRMGEQNADLSINSDATAAGQVKDSSARTRKSGIRAPLKEISENSVRMASSKQGLKDGQGRQGKTRNELPDKTENAVLKVHSKELPKSDLLQQALELSMSRSIKKSCEQFFSHDVQGLLMSDNEGIQLEGGLTMPASLSKACSILRAVADLNSGMPLYPIKKEA